MGWLVVGRSGKWQDAGPGEPGAVAGEVAGPGNAGGAVARWPPPGGRQRGGDPADPQPRAGRSSWRCCGAGIRTAAAPRRMFAAG